MIYGHELLGAAKYPDIAIKCLPKGRAGKVFLYEFGSAVPVIKGWAKRGVPVIAVQGLWDKDHNYSSPKMLKDAIAGCQVVNKIAGNYPHLEFHYSPFCEHAEKKQYMLKVMSELQPYANHLILVNNPCKLPSAQGDLLPGFYNEIHGAWNPNTSGLLYDWGCDGTSAVDCDIQMFKERHKAAKIQWLWIPQYNCKDTSEHTEDPLPKQRKVKPTKQQIISVDYLCEPKGSANLDSKWLYKSHADQQNDLEGREGKPLVICPVSADTVEAIASNNKKVCILPRAGNFSDGRPMYRAPIWGYEMQDKAVKLGGTKLVKLKIGGQSYGTVNPAFRQNFYRN